LQTFKDPLDLLFVPSHTLPLIRKPGLKTVLTVHDLGSEYLPQTHQIKQRLYLKLMTHYQLRSATHLIAVSKATKNDIILKVGIKADKISVVYEGFNPSLQVDTKVDIESYLKKAFDIDIFDYFLFVGTIQPRKNLERLIKAYAQYLHSPTSSKKIKKLILAGSKGWLSDEIYALPKSLGIEANITFLGYVTDADLAYLYHGAAAFTFPSLFEGFGLPILEAFACKCPVLTSNTSSMPEVAGDAAILVDPLSVDAIVRGLEQVTDSQKRQQLIQLGSIQVTKFSWQSTAKQTLALFQALLLSVSSD
jgi:glycosyltransferase involved in cell wall biosynthesis